MFARLFASRKARPHPPAAPPGTRIYAVGDIHGRVDLLRRLYAMIAEDAAAAPDQRRVAVHLGDYVDRGESSRQVIELLLDEPLAGFEPVYLRGNHEEMMLAFLEDPTMGPMWMFNGGDATLYSYGIGHQEGATPDERHVQLRRALQEALPARHLAFLRGLGLHHVEGDYLFVHAGIAPGRPLEQQDSQDLLWIREEFIHSTADHGSCVVHGHTIVPAPDIRPNRIGIDTGAYFTGVLTCVVLDGHDQRILHT